MGNKEKLRDKAESAVKLYKDGYKVYQIANKLHLSKTTIYKYLKELDTPVDKDSEHCVDKDLQIVNNSVHYVDNDKVNNIISMFIKNTPIKNIAESMGVSESLVESCIRNEIKANRHKKEEKMV